MSANCRVGGSIPSVCSPHVQVSLCKTLNPTLYLMSENRIEPSEISMLHFTGSSANNQRDRVCEWVKVYGLKRFSAVEIQLKITI